MELSDLQAMGAFVSRKPIKKTIEVTKPVTIPYIEWADPEIPEFNGEFETVSLDVYFRRPSFADQLAISKTMDGEREFGMLHRMVSKPDGSPLFESVDQVMLLDHWLVLPLMEAAGELLGKIQSSKPATSSGSS